jgi:hypothetical protein
VVTRSRRSADRAVLQSQITQLDETCDDVRYTRLPAVGGTAHVLEVVHLQVYHKTVGRTRAEAYRQMIENLETGDAS